MTYAHTFAAIPVGERFDYCGNVYRKRSTRTAEIVQSRTYDGERWAIHDEYRGVWGYFSQLDRVNHEWRWWRAMNDPKIQPIRSAESSRT